MPDTCETCRNSVWTRHRADAPVLSCVLRPYGSATVAPGDSCPEWEAETEEKDVPEAEE